MLVIIAILVVGSIIYSTFQGVKRGNVTPEERAANPTLMESIATTTGQFADRMERMRDEQQFKMEYCGWFRTFELIIAGNLRIAEAEADGDARLLERFPQLRTNADLRKSFEESMARSKSIGATYLASQKQQSGSRQTFREDHALREQALLAAGRPKAPAPTTDPDVTEMQARIFAEQSARHSDFVAEVRSRLEQAPEVRTYFEKRMLEDGRADLLRIHFPAETTVREAKPTARRTLSAVAIDWDTLTAEMAKSNTSPVKQKSVSGAVIDWSTLTSEVAKSGVALVKSSGQALTNSASLSVDSIQPPIRPAAPSPRAATTIAKVTPPQFRTDAPLHEQARGQRVASVIGLDDRRDAFIASCMDRDQESARIKGVPFDMEKSYKEADAAYDEEHPDPSATVLENKTTIRKFVVADTIDWGTLTNEVAKAEVGAIRPPRQVLTVTERLKASDQPHAAELRALAEAQSIPHLVHFTRCENLPSILRNGLRSIADCRAAGITGLNNDGHRLDNAPDGISLSIAFPNYRMFYKYRQLAPEADWAVLILSPEILWAKSCGFFRLNAADHRMRERPRAEVTTPQAFREMFETPEVARPGWLRAYDPTDPQAEVMVYDRIEPDLIEAVAFETRTSRDTWAHATGGRRTIHAGPRKGMFATREMARM